MGVILQVLVLNPLCYSCFGILLSLYLLDPFALQSGCSAHDNNRPTGLCYTNAPGWNITNTTSFTTQQCQTGEVIKVNTVVGVSKVVVLSHTHINPAEPVTAHLPVTHVAYVALSEYSYMLPVGEFLPVIHLWTMKKGFLVSGQLGLWYFLFILACWTDFIITSKNNSYLWTHFTSLIFFFLQFKIGSSKLQRQWLFVLVWVLAASGAAYRGKMMEEMSVMMPYDAPDMDQMSEEEILACLVAETGPNFTVRLGVARIHQISFAVQTLLEHHN